MRLFLVIALVGLCLAVPRAELAHSAANTPVVLAVLNRDALAIPFAAFNGKRWVAPWPQSLRGELPMTLDDVDRDWWGTGAPPQRFAVWWNGQKTGDTSITALAQVRVLCSARLGVRTDYKPKELAPPRLRQPYPKDGLLVSNDVPVGRIESVERDSAEWGRTLALIKGEFDKMEKRAIGSFDGWRHPVEERQRKATPITIEAMYRTPSDEQGWVTYFVESVRQYPPRLRDAGCGLATTGQGWVHFGPNGKSHVELTSRVTYCDRKGVGFMLPFGTIRVDDRTYWVYQYSGYDDEFYQVVRPEPDAVKVVAGYHAGSCPE
jgi:hypothetical protein